jgi:Family of unknown function (DUF6467)
MELTVRYHSGEARILTKVRNPELEHFQVGSLTGAVASQKVTEARNGSLSTVGNRASSVKAIRELDCNTNKWNRYESRP